MEPSTTAPAGRCIPSSNEVIPVVGLGTWQTFDVDESPEARAPLAATLERFARAGGRLIDSSPMYGRAEEVVGDLRHLVPDAFLATKVWIKGRDAGIAQMEVSMRRLRADVIDLMQIHNLVDWQVHLSTLRNWKREGRIRYLGVTHYTRSSFGELETIMRTEEIDFVQLPLSVGFPNAEERLLPLAAERRIGVIVNRPFEEGKLLERLRGIPVPEWTHEYACRTWSDIAMRWIVSHPQVTCVIPATKSEHHMAQNLLAAEGPLFDVENRARLCEAVRQAGGIDIPSA